MQGVLTPESIDYTQSDFNLWEHELTYSPIAIEASSLPEDLQLQKKTASLIGSVSMSGSVSCEFVSPETNAEHENLKPPMSLHEATKLAAEGDKEALALLGINAKIDYIERAYRAGFYCPPIELEKLDDGTLIQNGQTFEEVHTNTIRYIDNPKLKERAKKVEALNAIRDQYYSDAGLLKDNARVILSAVHEDMNDSEAEEAGFFVPTRSIAVQLLTEHEGKTIIQVAFVTAKDSKSGVFDIASIIAFANKLGINYEGAGSEEIAGRPLLINKKIIPDLIVSVTQLFDESASEVTGIPRFLGEAVDKTKTSTEYQEKFDECQNITKNMQNDIDAVVADLIKFQPNSPNNATSKLAELNDKLLKDRIVEDNTIDSRVLGTQAAYYVEHARHNYQLDPAIFIHQQRDMHLLQQIINMTGVSNSCPGGAKTNSSSDELTGMPDIFGDRSENDSDSQETVQDCEFISKQCPKCGEKDVVTICKDGKYYGKCKEKCVSD